MPQSYKVGVIADNSGQYAYNALRFGTPEQAHRYGSNLATRWTAVREYIVHESDEPVNARWNYETGITEHLNLGGA